MVTVGNMGVLSDKDNIGGEKNKTKQETLKSTLWTTPIHLLLTLSSHHPGRANPRF